jgi:Tol biopolymer transport system component
VNRATGCQILPDGRRVDFLTDTRRDVWEVTESAGQTARATGLGAGLPVSATYDGRWLAWTKEDGASRHRMLRDPSGREIELSRFDGDGFGPKLAADGSALLLRTASGSGNDWDILSLPGLRFLRRIEMDSIIWCVSKGAREVLQVGTPKIPRSIGVLKTDTGVVDTILVDPKLNLYLATLSPDERWVAFIGESTDEGTGVPPRIFVAPYNSNRLIPRDQWIEAGVGDYPAWNPTGNRIYALAPDEDRIMSIDFDPATGKAGGGPSATVYRFAPRWSLKGLPPGAFRIVVTLDRLLFNLGRRESVVEMAR